MNCEQPFSILCAQQGLETFVIVPQNKPIIERVLRVTSSITITKTAVIDKKIIYTAVIKNFAEYVGCVVGNSQPVHFVASEQCFNGFLDCPFAHPRMDAQLTANIEFQQCKAADYRKISLYSVIKVCLCKLEEMVCESEVYVCQSYAEVPCHVNEHHCPPIKPGGYAYSLMKCKCTPSHFPIDK